MATNFVYWVDHQSQIIASKLSLNSNEMINTINNFLAAFMVISVVILGCMIIMGYERDALRRFSGFFVKFIFISTILTSFNTYNSHVALTAEQIPKALVNLVNCKAKVNPKCIDENKFSRQTLMGDKGILDLQFSAFFVLSKAAWSKANILDNNIGMWFLSFALILFSTLFILGTGFILTAVFLMSKVLILFGPIFIACVLFKVTQNFFVKWFELLVKLIIIEVFTVIISVFIHDQLSALLLSFNNKLNFPTLAAITDFQLLYSQITLANVIMICSVFVLGIFILRLIVTVAHELSQGVKFAGGAIVQSSSQYFSSTPSSQNNYTAHNSANSNASYSSLFQNTATNQFKQNFQQNIANQGHTSGGGGGNINTNNYTSSSAISSAYTQNKSTKQSALNQYKMAYQNRFRGI